MFIRVVSYFSGKIKCRKLSGIFPEKFRKFSVPGEFYLYNKRRYVCLSVCLYVSVFRMAGQTAGPIETKLDTRTHVHPGSVSVKVNVKVIHVCVRE